MDLLATRMEHEEEMKEIEWSNIFLACRRMDIPKLIHIFQHFLMPNGKIDFVSCIIMLGQVGMTSLHPLFTIAGVALGTDPIHFLLIALTPSSIIQLPYVKVIITFGISGLLQFLLMAEGCRLATTLMVVCVIPSMFGIESLQYLNRFHLIKSKAGVFGRPRLERLHLLNQFYTRIEILGGRMIAEVPSMTFLLMVVGTGVSSSLNFMALKFFGIFPLVIYFMAVIMAVFVLIAVKSFVAITVSSHEELKDAICKWNKLPGRDKYLRKKFQLMRPPRVPAGVAGYTIYTLDKEIKSTYFRIILEVTIDILLCFPDSMITGWKIVNDC
jgi:hypothetical protein